MSENAVKDALSPPPTLELEEEVWALFREIELSSDEQHQTTLRERMLRLAYRNPPPGKI